MSKGSDDEREGGTIDNHFGKSAVIDAESGRNDAAAIGAVDGTVKEVDGTVKEVDGNAPLMSGTCVSC